MARGYKTKQKPLEKKPTQNRIYNSLVATEKVEIHRERAPGNIQMLLESGSPGKGNELTSMICKHCAPETRVNSGPHQGLEFPLLAPAQRCQEPEKPKAFLLVVQCWSENMDFEGP